MQIFASIFWRIQNALYTSWCPSYSWKEQKFRSHVSSSAASAYDDENWLCDTSCNYVCLLRVPLHNTRNSHRRWPAGRVTRLSELYVSYERSLQSLVIWGCPAIINCLSWMTIECKSNFIELRLIIDVSSPEQISLVRQFIMKCIVLTKIPSSMWISHPFSSVSEWICVATSEVNWVAWG